MQIAPKFLTNTLLVLGLAAASLCAQAESNINTGATSGLAASARLNFRVTVPRVIFLQLGSGTFMADGGTTDNVDWTLTAANLGTGALNASTGVVAARVLGNGGPISLTANGLAGGPSNGAQVIPWTSFSATTSLAGLPHPVIGNGAAGTPTLLAATNNVVNLSANWTFSYSNAAPIASGTYTGGVTYTAALP